MASTCADYAWLKQECGGWIETGYAFALVRNVEPGELLDLIGAGEERITTVGIEGEGSVAADWEHGLAGAAGAAMVSDEWCALAQCHSEWFCVDPATIEPIAVTHDWVAHASNINALSTFQWGEGGSLRTTFDPLISHPPLNYTYGGREPGALLDLVREVGGIRLEDGPIEDFIAGCFALADRITGVTITAEQLRTMEFMTASTERFRG
ncbi:hypothetical protein DFR67_116125 [Williamsia limnetica]|uniref:Uncharacterized protein n=1 Tax=Williamsia limnetica TaxID=882452 RepID=A0A318REC3_WILLI|nr:DUF6461 domain-containing protein [Williamsia limnetica]PYE13571.1 hypothetical protein DFR67_116125 [Williamsia limnetica]